jgi:hypothetical protein
LSSTGTYEQAQSSGKFGKQVLKRSVPEQNSYFVGKKTALADNPGKDVKNAASFAASLTFQTNINMNNLDTPDQFNAPEPPIGNTVLRYGLISGAVSIVISLLLYLLEVNTMTISGIVTTFLLAIGGAFLMVFLAVKYQRDQLMGGFISFGKAMVIGLLVTLIGSIISGLWNWLLFNVIDPEYVDRLKQLFVDTWGDKMGQDQLEDALTRFDDIGEFGKNLINGTVGGVVIGLLAGLVMGLAMRRERPIF